MSKIQLLEKLICFLLLFTFEKCVCNYKCPNTNALTQNEIIFLWVNKTKKEEINTKNAWVNTEEREVNE